MSRDRLLLGLKAAFHRLIYKGSDYNFRLQVASANALITALRGDSFYRLSKHQDRSACLVSSNGSHNLHTSHMMHFHTYGTDVPHTVGS